MKNQLPRTATTALLVVAILLPLAITSLGCKTAPIYVAHQELPNDQIASSAEEVIRAIERAASTRRHWEIVRLPDRLAFATLAWGSHAARMLIAYDERGFEIHYLGSSNLKASGGVIHKAYNAHVEWLEQQTLEELRRAQSG